MAHGHTDNISVCRLFRIVAHILRQRVGYTRCVAFAFGQSFFDFFPLHMVFHFMCICGAVIQHVSRRGKQRNSACDVRSCFKPLKVVLAACQPALFHKHRFTRKLIVELFAHIIV